MPESTTVPDERDRRVERRDFGRVLVAQFGSTLGSQMAFVATPLVAFVLTGSAAAAGIVGVANAVARTVTGVFAGALADRLNQTTVMVVCDVVRLGSNLLLWWIASWRVTASVVPLCTLIVVEGVFSTVFFPCEVVVVRRIVAVERLPARLARSESVTWTAALVGPLAGGALFAVDPGWPFLGNAVSYAVSAGCVLSLYVRRSGHTRPGAEHRRGVVTGGELFAGLRFLISDRFLRPTAIQIALHNVALGALSILVLVGAQQRGVPGVAIGSLVSAQAVGAIVGSLSAMRILGRIGAGRVVLLTGWIWVVLVPVIITVHHWQVAAVLLACLWVFAPIQRTVTGSYRGQRVPPALLGRVSSASQLLTGSLAALGPGLGGVLYQAHRPTVAVAVITAVTLPPVLASTFGARIGRVTIDIE